MEKMKNREIVEMLNWRYAVKKFDVNKKISPENWAVLEESLHMSPSSYGVQPWRFLVVQNPEIRKKLTPLSWNQTQIEDCSHLVVLTTKVKIDQEYVSRIIENTAKVREVDVGSLDGYKNMMMGDLVNGPRSSTIGHWAQRQAYIAMGFLMETAALLEIDTCPMEGLDPKGYDKVLGIEGSGYETLAAVAVGYRHSEDSYQKAPKVRFEKSEVIKYI